jgi:hypothetical protein
MQVHVSSQSASTHSTPSMLVGSPKSPLLASQPQRRPRVLKGSPLAHLGPDLLCAVGSWLDIAAVYSYSVAVRQSSSSLESRAMLFKAAVDGCLTGEIAMRREAINVAVRRGDPGLAAFAVNAMTDNALPAAGSPRFAGFDADHTHPLFDAYLFGAVTDNCGNVGGTKEEATLESDRSDGIDIAASGPGPGTGRWVTLPVVQVLLNNYLAAGGSLAGALSPSVLSKCPSDSAVCAMLRCGVSCSFDAAAGDAEDTVHALIISLALRGRENIVCWAIGEWPMLAVSRSTLHSCDSCRGLHGLLHVAAEIGSVEIVRAVAAGLAASEPAAAELTNDDVSDDDNDDIYRQGHVRQRSLPCRLPHFRAPSLVSAPSLSSLRVYSADIEIKSGKDKDDDSDDPNARESAGDLLGAHDCNGESALGIAVRCRRPVVAQELVRRGAEISDLVGAFRGGRAANQAWFKLTLDVD